MLIKVLTYSTSFTPKANIMIMLYHNIHSEWILYAEFDNYNMGIEKTTDALYPMCCWIKQKPYNDYNYYSNGRINNFEVTC